MTGGTQPRVLLVPSNGVGLGHLTRTAAIGRRLREAGATPIICALSPLLAPLRALGFLVEHVPSYTATPLPRWHWQRLLAQQLEHLSSVYEVGAVVFDGVAPYRGVRQAMAAEHAPPYAWVRRGRWKPGTGSPEPVGAFQLVIEPGEVDATPQPPTEAPPAKPTDARVHTVEPILLADHHDLLDAADARSRLDLSPTGRYGLISFGTGVDGPLGPAVAEMAAAMQARDLTPVIAASPLVPPPPLPNGALLRRHYPLAPLLDAFELVAVAAGYNSVAEVAACHVPAVIVPNPAAARDDQAARALGLDREGLAVAWTTQPGGAVDAVDRVLSNHAELVTALAARPVPRGATQAAELILELAS